MAELTEIELNEMIQSAVTEHDNAMKMTATASAMVPATQSTAVVATPAAQAPTEEIAEPEAVSSEETATARKRKGYRKRSKGSKKKRSRGKRSRSRSRGKRRCRSRTGQYKRCPSKKYSGSRKR